MSLRGRFWFQKECADFCPVNRSQSVTNLQGVMGVYRLIKCPKSLLRAFEGL